MTERPVSFEALLAQARAILNPRRLSEHASAGGVGAALLSGLGAVYVGVCVETSSGMGFCAEHAAAAAMLTAGESRVLKMVALNRDGAVLPPCGRCREFVSQLDGGNRDTQVLVAEGVVRTLRELLPFDWREAAAASLEPPTP